MIAESLSCQANASLLRQGAIDRVTQLLSPDDFYKPSHQTIFSAMLALFEKSEPQDLITVSNVLQDGHKLAEVGGPTYLSTLTDIVPFSANITHYAKIVRNKAILKALQKGEPIPDEFDEDDGASEDEEEKQSCKDRSVSGAQSQITKQCHDDGCDCSSNKTAVKEVAAAVEIKSSIWN